MLVVGLSVAVVWLGRRHPFLFTGWFWFVGALIPAIGLVQVGNQSMADRYTYLPLIGLFIILAWGMGELGAGRGRPGQLMVLAALFLLVACGLRTRDQIGYWRNSETLFRRALAVTQNNFVAFDGLGLCLLERGQTAEAIDCYDKSLQIKPDNPNALYNLGNASSGPAIRTPPWTNSAAPAKSRRPEPTS